MPRIVCSYAPLFFFDRHLKVVNIEFLKENIVVLTLFACVGYFVSSSKGILDYRFASQFIIMLGLIIYLTYICVVMIYLLNFT